MEAILYVLAAVCLILGVIKAHAGCKGNRDFELIAKTCGAVTFICLGILAFYLAELPKEKISYGLGVIIALVLGMVGDIFLCLDNSNAHPERKNLIQTVGVMFFFLGHICYMFNMLSLEKLNLYLLPALLVLPIVYIVLAKTVLTSNLIQNIMLTIYYLALNIILVSAINLIIIYGATAFTMILFFASLLFISSDTVLGLSWFAPKLKLPKTYDYYIILSYFAAQCLFGLSIFFI